MRPKYVGKLVVFIIIFTMLWGFAAPKGEAELRASLYLSPPSGTFAVGSTFTVSLVLDTGNKFINAVEADLSFPPDKLQVVSPTTGRSFIQVWVAQPTYDNSTGRLKFQGAVPNPGINTSAGVISTITFRVRSTGTAQIKILDSSKVLLNNGLGTDVLEQRTSGTYYLSLPPPAGPIVTSSTHPDQERWYPLKDAVFRWTPPEGNQGYSFVLNESPIDEPDEISEGAKDSVVYKNITPGLHYFHIKSLRNGIWGGTTHYQIRVDDQPPAAFKISFPPDDSTSNKRPIIDFGTTDVVSGIDHYELKIIPLDPSGDAQNMGTPFFIEAQSPYSTELKVGRYDVVVRAFDAAGNYYQTSASLNIVMPIFSFIRDGGLRIKDTVTIPWGVVIGIIALLITLLGYALYKIWKWHRYVGDQLKAGAVQNPYITSKMQELAQKQKEYRSSAPTALVLLLAFAAAGLLWPLASEAQRTPDDLIIPPPIVTLFPEAISNNEILYVGGQSGLQNAEVLIYIQDTSNGAVQSKTVITDEKGNWFYNHPQFLEAGEYKIWTQARAFNKLSPPSPELRLEVAPAAIRIAGKNLTYQTLYLILLIFALAVIAALVILIFYHASAFKRKKGQLLKEIQEAEESVRRGFALLRKDIELELATVRRMKATKELGAEEKIREEKLIRDLEYVNSYIGKEIWDIENLEKTI